MPDKQYLGWATRFADPNDIQAYREAIAAGKSEKQALLVGDNGIGHDNLGSISTGDTFGVAVPREQLMRQFGTDPSAWRTARANVTYGDQSVQVPIIDVGPGQKQQKSGVITDLSYPLSVAMGTGEKAPVRMTLTANAGPDYLENPQAWKEEQSKIGTSLQMGPLIGVGALTGSLVGQDELTRQRGLMNV